MHIGSSTSHFYRALGIEFHSQIGLTSNQIEDIEVNTQAYSEMLMIRQRPLDDFDPKNWKQVAACCWFDGKQLRLKLPELGWLQISPIEISYDLDPKADLSLLQVYLQSYALGVQAMLRRQLVLHASTVSRNGKAIVICGCSGVGKSTLAAALLAKGFTLVSDEITVINAEGLVQPGFNDIKIWRDTVDELALPREQLQSVRTGLEKYYYRPNHVSQHPVPIAAIYVLGTDNRVAMELKVVHGFGKFEPLRAQAYRHFLLAPLGLDSIYLKLSGDLLRKTPLVNVSRNLQRLKAEALIPLANAIEHNAQGWGC